MAGRLSIQEICNKLFLAMDALMGHPGLIYAMLDVHSRAKAAAKGRDPGLIR